MECFPEKFAPDIPVHKVVFDRVQPGRELVICDAQLIQALGLFFGQRTEKVLDQELITSLLA